MKGVKSILKKRYLRPILAHKARKNLRVGSRLELKGDINESIIYYHNVLKSDAPFSEDYKRIALLNLGKIYLNMDNLKNAQHSYVKYRRLTKNNLFHSDIFHTLNGYEEVTPQYYKRFDSNEECRNILFLFTGAMGDIVCAFTTIKALKKKHPLSSITWATIKPYFELVKMSGIDQVIECSDRLDIPIDWIEQNLPDKIFYPEPAAHYLEIIEIGSHFCEFIAKSCNVQPQKNRTIIPNDIRANQSVREYLESKGIKNDYITLSHVTTTSKAWKLTLVKKFIRKVKVPVVLLGSKTDPKIKGAIHFFGKPIPQLIEIIRSSKLFIGPDSGCSWLASTTDVAMLVLMDPQRPKEFPVGFVNLLNGEKNNIIEGTIDWSVTQVLDKLNELLNISRR